MKIFGHIYQNSSMFDQKHPLLSEFDEYFLCDVKSIFLFGNETYYLLKACF